MGGQERDLRLAAGEDRKDRSHSPDLPNRIHFGYPLQNPLRNGLQRANHQEIGWWEGVSPITGSGFHPFHAFGPFHYSLKKGLLQKVLPLPGIHPEQRPMGISGHLEGGPIHLHHFYDSASRGDGGNAMPGSGS